MARRPIDQTRVGTNAQRPAELPEKEPRYTRKRRKGQPPPIPTQPEKLPRFVSDPIVEKKFLTAIEMGMRPEEAAALVGLNVRTVQKWNQLARMGVEPYMEFEKKVVKAEAKSLKRWVRVIDKAAIGTLSDKPADWKAGAWLIERRHKSWSQKVQISFETDTAAQLLVQLIQEECGGETTERILRRFFDQSSQDLPGHARANPAGSTAGGTEEGAGETASGTDP